MSRSARDKPGVGIAQISVPEFKEFVGKHAISEEVGPIGDLRLDEGDFVWPMSEIANVSKVHGSGRMVSVLEGGYHPDVVACAGAAHVADLMAA